MLTMHSLTKKQLEIFHKLLDELGILEYNSIDFTPGVEAGENFFGYIIQAEIKQSKASSKLSHFIIKCSPPGDKFCTLAPVHGSYLKEIYMYSKVFPEFLAIQNERQVSRPFYTHPTFYKHCDELREEMLIFNNMKLLGFEHHPRTQCLDYDHVSLILQEYAKLHALSYATRDQKPKLFEKMASHMGDTFFENFSRPSFTEIARHRIKETIKAFNPNDDKLVYDYLERFSGHMFLKLIELMDFRTRYDVFSHIDSGIANFLFKYVDAEKQGGPSQVCILDYQLSRLASPAVDLVCFLFSATDKVVREHYDELIEKYYNFLCDFLREIGSDGKQLLPFSVLQSHLKQHAIVGLFWAIHILYLQSTVSQTVPDVFENDSYKDEEITFLFDLKDRSVFDGRVRDSILDFVRLGYDFP